jgi:hypothetical protein
MRDYIEIGPTPCDENCAQVGDDNFRMIADKEMSIYIDQLNRMFGDLIKNSHSVSFSKKWFAHDFGTYGEVVINFDDEKDSEIPYKIERNLPEQWDEEALKQIKLFKQENK